MKEGRIVASKPPRRRRQIKRPGKVFADEVQRVTIVPVDLSVGSTIKMGTLLTSSHIEHDPIFYRKDDECIG
jgi:hypothetical protein